MDDRTPGDLGEHGGDIGVTQRIRTGDEQIGVRGVVVGEGASQERQHDSGRIGGTGRRDEVDPVHHPAAERAQSSAARDREAVLAAADRLFAEHENPGTVTMADIAAAGVGKATLLRSFGDRTGLIRALHESRLAPGRTAVEARPRRASSRGECWERGRRQRRSSWQALTAMRRLPSR
nr:helix-turn-helix domain-containing protein [Streptomyces sp. ZEA17I]